MNISYNNLIRKLKRITRELKETDQEITETLERSESTLQSVRYGTKIKNTAQLDRMRRRVRDATLHLVTATTEENANV